MKKPKVTFWLKESGKKSKDKPVLIMLNLSYHRKRLKSSTGLSIKLSNWDEDRALPKTSFADYSTYKRMLFELEEKALEGYQLSIEKGIIPEPETIKQHIQKKEALKQESDVKNIYAFYTEFLEAKQPEVKEITYAKYITLQKYLKDYEKKHKCSLTFESMDAEFGVKFKHFLNTVKGNNNNAASKTLDCVKVFLKWAQKKGYHKELHYTDIKSKREKTEVVFLNLSELKQLLELELEPDSKLARTRDMFCFHCLTGQRYSDIESLRWEHFIPEDENLFWHLFQKKSNKPEKVIIPVFKPTQELLDRQYKGGQTVFPKITNQKLNANIKELCKMAGLDSYVHKVTYSGKKQIDLSGPKYEHISSHTGRKSFVNICYYDLGMDKESIRAITGHANDKMLNIYLGEDKKHVFKQMAKWNDI